MNFSYHKEDAWKVTLSSRFLAPPWGRMPVSCHWNLSCHLATLFPQSRSILARLAQLLEKYDIEIWLPNSGFTCSPSDSVGFLKANPLVIPH